MGDRLIEIEIPAHSRNANHQERRKMPYRYHRQIMVWAVVTSVVLGCLPMAVVGEEFSSDFPEDAERAWAGPEFWANRLQDWRVADGRLECLEGRKAKPMRTVHLLTARLARRDGDLLSSVRTGILGDTGKASARAATGFLIGAGRGLEYRAAALIHHSTGPDGGLFAGIDGTGALFIRDFSLDNEVLVKQDKGNGVPSDVGLRFSARPSRGAYELALESYDPATGAKTSGISLAGVDAARLEGNVALVSHPGTGGRFWFRDWRVSGEKVDVHEGRVCGPILGTQYTLSRDVLKLTAQMMPIGESDTQDARLQLRSAGSWETIATTQILAPGYTATFRVTDWDASQDRPYRVAYDYRQQDGSVKLYTWPGTIRRDPVEKRSIAVAGFTGNHNMSWGVERGPFNWNENGVWFPHTEIVDHVAKQKPDVLFFSGDQVYEGASPTSPDRKNAELDYLYKWYLWCWAFRDLTRDIPTVTIPDDHDVFQPNLWGAGGPKVPKDDHGGYVMPAEWVNMVERTQTSHLPDPYDPTPIEQGIGVYYTSMNYGRISFAVLEDRKFKSGCRGIIPDKKGRPDHINEPGYDPRTVDLPGLKLLGDRQLAFLRDWAGDWAGVDMKAALSQTVFANVASHHGGNLTYLLADLDSNGWPQTGRKNALHEFRRCFAFMIGGDQHLSTIVHHGIDDWNDAGWSMCVPSIANFYPRAWRPPQEPRNHIEGMPEYTGEFLDGLGNYVTVWAATNPGKPMGHEPARLHNRMPGYGIVRFDKQSRDITIECWPRFADPAGPDAKQYLGWPKTISQLDNYSRKATAYLPTIKVTGMADPVVQVIDEADGEIVYTLRIKGTSFRPKVFRDGKYTLLVGELGTDQLKTLKGVQSIPADEEQTIEMDL